MNHFNTFLDEHPIKLIHFFIENGEVTSYSHYVEQTGWAYYKTHNTNAFRLDPSVVEVNSVGTFQAFKYFTEYMTHITVRLLGSGNYTIQELRIADPV